MLLIWFIVTFVTPPIIFKKLSLIIPVNVKAVTMLATKLVWIYVEMVIYKIYLMAVMMET